MNEKIIKQTIMDQITIKDDKVFFMNEYLCDKTDTTDNLLDKEEVKMAARDIINNKLKINFI